MVYGQSAGQQYQQYCKSCHGDDGKGHTTLGKMVNAWDLTSDAVAKASDAELKAVIGNGKGKMNGFGVKLGGDAGVVNMLGYVRSLKK